MTRDHRRRPSFTTMSGPSARTSNGSTREPKASAEVRFIRSYVSVGKEIPETKNVTIRYSTTDDGVKEEEFDLVVLSVGLNPPDNVEALAAHVRHRTQCPRVLQGRIRPIRSRPPGRGSLSAAPSRAPWISPSRS